MQYNIDLKSKHAKNFKLIRKLLLSYDEITELKNAKQTSYRDSYGVVVIMRTKGDVLVVAFGKGKIVRHLYFKEEESVDEALLRAMIEESLILNIEGFEMKELRKRQ